MVTPQVRLNPEQQAAVEHTEGPLLVLAGAGTGKTRVITARIGHLLRNGILPEQVLAMTFTNKAAREMRERISEMVGKERAGFITMGTFHSFCARLLRRHGEIVGLPKQYTICDSSDQLATVRAALRELRVGEEKMKPSTALSRISLWKNQLVTPDQAAAMEGDDQDELVARAYRKYEASLRRSRVVDFDDLLLMTLQVMQKDAALRARLQDQFRYLLVDEYQDTNGPQYEILRILSATHRNLCVVGDDDQSIYGWRGADVRKILRFDQDFPDAETVRLETNYRCTPEILAAANLVIANNRARHPKELRAFEASGVPVTWLGMYDELQEASFIVTEIRQTVERGEANFGDFAILFRTQSQPRAFEAELRRQKLPYQLTGSQSFFDRKEVRDILAYLKLLANDEDEVSLLRVINTPPRGIGKGTIDNLVGAATESGLTANAIIDQILLDKEDGPKIPARALASLKELFGNLASLRMRLAHGDDLAQIVGELITRIDYKTEIERQYDDHQTRETRWNGVLEVVDFALNYARSARKASLDGFLEELALNAEDHREDSEKERPQAISLMTLHSAKGLEFLRVYLVGFEEGTLPHKRSAAEGNVEEERRLAYVGITRARRVLTISWAEQRSRYGRMTPCHVSRFYFEATGETPPKGWVAADQFVPAGR
jgi:DNA helicase II / ATP-dependent DNA helicase PcrA